MDLTKTEVLGCVLGVVLAGVLLAGCSTGQVPNQRVYDRYATLMQERRQQQLASQTAAATAADPERISVSGPVSRPPARNTASKPAPARQAPSALPAPGKRQPISKPMPATVSEPEQPAVSGNAAETGSVPAGTALPPVEVVPAPAPGSGEITDTGHGSDSEETWDEPEEAPAPPPPPVEVIPEPAPVRNSSAYEPQAVPDSADSELSAYALRVGDGVAITLRGIPTPEKIECQVDEYGMIPLPLINDVRAEGLSAAELQKTIRQIYLDRGIYKNINVTVLIPTRYYYTQGEFKNQGKFQLVSAITLSQAIAATGYFTDFASGRVLIRRNGAIFKTVRNARNLDRTPEDDILIEPNDIIEAVRSRW